MYKTFVNIRMSQILPPSRQTQDPSQDHQWAGRVQTRFTEENILSSACAGLRCVKQDQQNDLSRSPAAAGTAANPSERRSHLRTVTAKVGTDVGTQHSRDAFLVLGVQFRCFSPEGQGSC
ncbi:hypothetical protein LEMLEM_LOCUS3410 [Lemmus lemmus]